MGAQQFYDAPQKTIALTLPRPLATGYLSKVPQVAIGFWIIKIAATTLGETGGDALSMGLGLGYLTSTLIFFALFLVLVFAQIKAKRFYPYLYWAVVVATTLAGTTMADFADRSLGVGYPGGTSILFALVLASLAAWKLAVGTVSVDHIATPKAESFYWLTILFSNTLGTALGDWTAKAPASAAASSSFWASSSSSPASTSSPGSTAPCSSGQPSSSPAPSALPWATSLRSRTAMAALA